MSTLPMAIGTFVPITISLNVSAFFPTLLNFRDFFTAQKPSFGVLHCRGTYVPLEEQSLNKMNRAHPNPAFLQKIPSELTLFL